jgi:diguanylate cyclase (GGDEF)-like protein
MSSGATQTLAARAQARPRVLVVGNADLADALRQARPWLPDDIERVEDDLSALGRLAHVSPDLLVAQRDRLGESRLATLVDAFHQVAPQTRLLLVSESSNGQLASDEQAGFDWCVAAPLTVDDWRGVLDHALPMPADEPSPPTPPVSQDPGHESAPAPAAAGDAAIPPVPPEDQPLGDVDLVEHLLHRGHQVGELGARIVAQRGGFADVHFTRQRSTVPPGRTRVPVRHHRKVLGHLHAPAQVPAEQLLPWAQWLAKWVLLQRRMDRLYHDAHTDPLTGVYCRRYFDRFLTQVLERAATQRFQVTVMVFDIDDFKIYNDRYGHAAGDEILIETARLMQSVVRKHDVVARIGGDEFAVIFWDPEGPRKPNSQHPIDVQKAAARFQRAICDQRFPKLFDQAPGTLTISGGLAGFPWDGRTPQDLLNQADLMALQSKQQGKNAITFGPGAARSCRIALGQEPNPGT